MYLLGTSVYSTVVRNNNQYSYIGRKSLYNPNYQYSIFLQSPVVLQQGDQLITTCVYDTTESSGYLFVSSIILYSIKKCPKMTIWGPPQSASNSQYSIIMMYNTFLRII